MNSCTHNNQPIYHLAIWTFGDLIIWRSDHFGLQKYIFTSLRSVGGSTTEYETDTARNTFDWIHRCPTNTSTSYFDAASDLWYVFYVWFVCFLFLYFLAAYYVVRSRLTLIWNEWLGCWFGGYRGIGDPRDDCETGAETGVPYVAERSETVGVVGGISKVFWQFDREAGIYSIISVTNN